MDGLPEAEETEPILGRTVIGVVAIGSCVGDAIGEAFAESDFNDRGDIGGCAWLDGVMQGL